MINETYSAFVQGFMPTLARPEVDVLEGLTTAIIVDQERMGANPRSTVGTATDANAMLRILFSRLGEPRIGSPERVLLQHPHGASQRRDHRRRAARATKAEEVPRRRLRRHVPALRGHGQRQRHRPDRVVRRQRVARRGRAHGPRLQHGRLVRPDLPRQWLFDPDKPIGKFTEKEAARPAPPGADQDQGRRDQPDLRGADPEDPKSLLSKDVDALQPHVRAFVERAVTFQPVRSATAPGSARRRARRGSGARTSPTSARCRSATSPTGSAGSTSRRWPAARRAAAPARLVRGDRAGLPLARPARGHAVRGRPSAPR